MPAFVCPFCPAEYGSPVELAQHKLDRHKADLLAVKNDAAYLNRTFAPILTKLLNGIADEPPEDA